MSTKLFYRSNDLESVKKAFSVLMVQLGWDKTAVLTAMENNSLAVANADDWAGEIKQNVEVTQPWVIGEPVKVGELRRYNEINYVVIQAHTTQADWTPPQVPALFLARVPPAPGEEYPAWVQPTGAHDAYAIGARVTHNGLNWENTVNANVWEPGVFGWTQIA